MILGTNPKRAFLEVIFSLRLYAFHNPKKVSIMVDKATNSYTGKGIAESFEDIIFDISPEDTPLYQWQSA